MNHDLLASFISQSPPIPVSPLYWIFFFASLHLCAFAFLPI